jgi:phage terminase large subunit GpA-like protein
VRYVCQHHGCEILEHQKPAMLAGGVWVASRESSRPGKLTGYHLNALYAPLGWVSWADLVQQFTEAAQAAKQGDVSKLKTFTNTVLAETWEEQGDKIAHHELARRAEDYQLSTVPWGGLLVTAGVDTQGDRLEAYAWAVGRQNERWLVDHRVFYGDPSQPRGPARQPMGSAHRVAPCAIHARQRRSHAAHRPARLTPVATTPSRSTTTAGAIRVSTSSPSRAPARQTSP